MPRVPISGRGDQEDWEIRRVGTGEQEGRRSKIRRISALDQWNISGRHCCSCPASFASTEGSPSSPAPETASAARTRSLLASARREGGRQRPRRRPARAAARARRRPTRWSRRSRRPAARPSPTTTRSRTAPRSSRRALDTFGAHRHRRQQRRHPARHQLPEDERPRTGTSSTASTCSARSASPTRRGPTCATRATAASSSPPRPPASTATSARPTTRWPSSALVGSRQHARARGREEERPRQHHRADRRLAHDRDRAPQGARRRAQARVRQPARRLALPRELRPRPAASSRSAAASWRSCAGSGARGRDVQARARDHAGARARQLGAPSPASRRRRTRPTSPTSMQPVIANLDSRRAAAATSSSTSTRRSATSSPLTTSTLRRAGPGALRAGRGRGAGPARRTGPAATSTRCTATASSRCRPTRSSRRSTPSSSWPPRGKKAPGLNYGLDRVLHGEQYTRGQAAAAREGERSTHKARSRTSSTRASTRSSSPRSTPTTRDRASFWRQRGHHLRARRGRLGRRPRALQRHQRAAGPRAGPRVVDREDRRQPGAALSPLRRLEPAARRPRLRAGLRLRAAHPPRAVHLRLRGPARDQRRSRRTATRASSRASRCASPTRCSPGETLQTEMWQDGRPRIVFRCARASSADKVVISNAAIAFHAEIPNEASGQRFTAATSSQRRGSVVTSKRSQTAPTASMSAAATTSDG